MPLRSGSWHILFDSRLHLRISHGFYTEVSKTGILLDNKQQLVVTVYGDIDKSVTFLTKHENVCHVINERQQVTGKSK